MSIEAMKQAQAAIKSALDFYAAMFGVPVDSMLVTHHSEAKALFEACKAAMESLSTAIEQAEKQEPVAWTDENFTEIFVSQDIAEDMGAEVPLYTTPPAAPVQEPEEWDERCVLGHCGSPTGCELSNRCRADNTPAAQPAPVQERVKVWDAEGYDALMQQMEMVKTENKRLAALVRAQQITIEKLEAQRQWVSLTKEDAKQAILPLCVNEGVAERLVEVSMDEYRAIEAKLREKNGGQA